MYGAFILKKWLLYLFECIYTMTSKQFWFQSKIGLKKILMQKAKVNLNQIDQLLGGKKTIPPVHFFGWNCAAQGLLQN